MEKIKKYIKEITKLPVFFLLLALLLVSVIVAMPAIFEENITSVDEKSIKLPDFQPGIKDKLSYEEEMEYMNNLTPTQPLAESDIIQIILPEAWFLKNDEDPNLEIVKTTFPKKWLNKAPVSDSEPIVSLQIPKKMLELDNTSEDPNQITVSYPVDRFKFYSNIDEMKMDEMNRKREIESINNLTSTKPLPDFQPSISDKLSYEEEMESYE